MKTAEFKHRSLTHANIYVLKQLSKTIYAAKQVENMEALACEMLQITLSRAMQFKK